MQSVEREEIVLVLFFLLRQMLPAANPYLPGSAGYGYAGTRNSDREVSIWTCNSYNTVQRYNKRAIMVALLRCVWLRALSSSSTRRLVHLRFGNYGPCSDCSERG